MFATVAQFFLDQWIWSITWGLYQAIASVALLTILFWFFLRCSLLSSFFLVTASQLCAMIGLSLFVYGIILSLFGYSYPPTEQGAVESLRLIEVAVLLGITYTVLQLFFFKVFKIAFEVPYYIVTLVLLTGNMFGALWTYWSLPTV